MAMGIIHRSPTEDDLEGIARIYNHAVINTAATFDTEEKSPNYFTPFLTREGVYRMMVAVRDGEVVAYAGTYPFSQRKAYAQLAELMIYVHPDWQQRNVGSTLLALVHQDDFLDGLFTVLALINKESTHMARLLERLGYSSKGEMTDVAFKLGKRHSLLIYQRHVREDSVRELEV